MKVILEDKAGERVPTRIELENDSEAEFLLNQLRPKGKWILHSRTPGFFGRNDEDNFKCSVCGKITSQTCVGIVANEITPFCPQCGASMSKDVERMI